MNDARHGLERQAAQLIRAAHFLGRPSTLPMPDRVVGNGLRELDLFLTDLIAQAVWLMALQHHPLRMVPIQRIYSAAEAWRRACLDPAHYPALKQARADQNRLAFARRAPGTAPTAFARADICAFYAMLAQCIVEAVYLPRKRALRAA